MDRCLCIAQSTNTQCRHTKIPKSNFCFQHQSCKNSVHLKTQMLEKSPLKDDSKKTYFDVKDFGYYNLAPLSSTLNKLFYIKNRTFIFKNYRIKLENVTGPLSAQLRQAEINVTVFKENSTEYGIIDFIQDRSKDELYIAQFHNYFKDSPGIMRKVLCIILTYFYDADLWRGLVTLLAYGTGPKNFSLNQRGFDVTESSIMKLSKYYKKYFGFSKMYTTISGIQNGIKMKGQIKDLISVCRQKI